MLKTWGYLSQVQKCFLIMKRSSGYRFVLTAVIHSSTLMISTRTDLLSMLGKDLWRNMRWVWDEQWYEGSPTPVFQQMKNGKCYQIGLYALFSPLFRTIYHFLITVVGFLRLLCILTEYYVQFDWLFPWIYRRTGHRRRHYLKRFSNFAPLLL